jgi:hypothetical protein
MSTAVVLLEAKIAELEAELRMERGRRYMAEMHLRNAKKDLGKIFLGTPWDELQDYHRENAAILAEREGKLMEKINAS